jgi:hypothetical protein
MNERELEIMELLCIPEATDDLEDIEFDDADNAAERDFIEGWIREEWEYNASIAPMYGRNGETI